MPPPTKEEIANRRRMIRQALGRLDPQGGTPDALYERKSFLSHHYPFSPLRTYILFCSSPIPHFEPRYVFDRLITNWILILQ